MTRPVDTEKQLTGALKMVEQLKNCPPWLAFAIMLFTAVGGGGGGVGYLGYNKIVAQLEEIQETQTQFTRKLDSIEWRINRNSSRLDGQATKNREQDATLRQVENATTRIETRMNVRDRP